MHSHMIAFSPSLPPSSPAGSLQANPFDDEQLELRLHVFSKCKSLMNQANERGYVLDWENRIAKSPVPWHWPVDEHGNRFPAAMLNHAYMYYDFTPPCCLCNTQEVNPVIFHQAKICVVRNPDSKFHQTVALGCRSHYQGCAIFVSLTEMEDHPDLLTQKYPRRRFPRKGLFGFDPVGTLTASQKTLPISHSSISNSTPNTPTPPSRFISQTRSSGFSVGRGRKRASPSTLSILLSSPKKVKQPSTGNCYDSEEDEVDDILTFPTSAQPPSKRQPSLPISISDSDESISSVKIKKEPTDTTRNVSCALLPSERFFGDTDAIFSPPDISYATKKNSDVPPLDQAEVAAALTGLQSGQGIKSEIAWRMYDKCDCSAWVRKDMMVVHRDKYCILLPCPNTSTHAAVNSLSSMSSSLPPKTPPLGPTSLSDPVKTIGRWSPQKAIDNDNNSSHIPFSSPVVARGSKLRGYDHFTDYRLLSSPPISAGKNGPYTLPPMSSGLSAPFAAYDTAHYRYAESLKDPSYHPSYHPPLNLNPASTVCALMNLIDSSAGPTYFDNSSANSSVNSPALFFASVDSQY